MAHPPRAHHERLMDFQGVTKMDSGWTAKERTASVNTFKLMLLTVFVALLIATGASESRQQIAPLPLSGGTEESDKEFQKRVPEMKVSAEGGSFTLSNLQLVK